MTERFLLDTNVILVAMEAPERLPPKIHPILLAGGTFVSVISYWEVQVKSMQGKLSVGDTRSWWEKTLLFLQSIAVPLQTQHITGIAGLPPIHKDPFDRALLAQATVEGHTLLTADPVLAPYESQSLRIRCFNLRGKDFPRHH